jgi:hypothetical protein
MSVIEKDLSVTMVVDSTKYVAVAKDNANLCCDTLVARANSIALKYPGVMSELVCQAYIDSAEVVRQLFKVHGHEVPKAASVLGIVKPVEHEA